MNIYDTIESSRTKTIFDLPLRVTFYARVSSDSKDQLNSLENQIGYYSNYIKEKSNWTYCEGYIDEGISGISVEKREAFNRMIDDAKEGKFDLIVTKEISRFARNTLDSILYMRELRRAGVVVLFESDGLHTLDLDSEFVLGLRSGMAQDESRKLSTRIKFGHQQAIKNGVVLGNSRIIGYDKFEKRLIINEEQAVMVRELFEMYATGRYSLKQLENIFYDKGYRNLNGNKYAHNTLSGILANPKYKGYYVGNKVKTIDMFTKEQKFLPPEEWVMYKDESGEIVPEIVSEELWDKANEVLSRRSEDVKSRQGICNHKNILTGKLFCTCCGLPYYRRESSDKKKTGNSRWVCSGKVKSGADSCPSFAIYENEIRPLLFDVFRNTREDANALAEEYLEMYREIDRSGNIAKQISRLHTLIEKENAKKSKLLEYNISGRMTDTDFLSMNAASLQKIQQAEMEIEELQEQQNSQADLKKHIATIRSALAAAEKDAESGIITKEFIDKYIDKIFVTPKDDGTMELKIKIITGDVVDKYLHNLRSHTGTMSKKMIEAYENGLK